MNGARRRWIMSEDMRVITEIADMFVTEAPAKAAERYGCGHINDTYRVSDERGKRYILQKINHIASPQSSFTFVFILFFLSKYRKIATFS